MNNSKIILFSETQDQIRIKNYQANSYKLDIVCNDLYFCWHSFHLYVYLSDILTEFISVTQFVFSLNPEYFANTVNPTTFTRFFFLSE